MASPGGPAYAQQNPNVTELIHHRVTVAVATNAAEVKAWALFASSDYVYGGDTNSSYTEEDMAKPLNLYGETKLLGEFAILDRNAGSVLRLPCLRGRTTSQHKAGWSRIARDMARNQPVIGVADEFRSPVTFEQAAKVILFLADIRFRGLINGGGLEKLTPYDVLIRFRDELGSSSRIVPVQRQSYSPDIERPKNVSMNSYKLHHLVNEYCGDVFPINTEAPGLQLGY